MIALPYDAEQRQLLQQTIKSFLTAQNSVQVKMCTLKLRQILKAGNTLGSLLEMLGSAADRHTLQLTIVLVSKIIKTEYGMLPEPLKDAARQILLQRLIHVPNDSQLERALSSLICKLLEIVPFNNWPSLQQYIDQIMKDNSRRFLVVLCQITRYFPPPPLLLQYLHDCMQNLELSEYALNCVEAVFQAHWTTLEKNTLEKLIDNYDPNYHTDNQNVKLLEILTESAKKLKKLQPKLFTFVCKNFIANAGLSTRVRSCGIDFIFIASIKQEKLLSKKSFIKEIVEAACAACSESAGPPSKEAQILKDVALYLLEARITKLHNKNAFGVLFDTFSSLIMSSQPDQMSTGFTVMTGISQSCTEKLRLKLAKPIMSDFIPMGLNHSETKVRTAAIHCLCYFCEFLYPDILDYYQLILNALMKNINELGEDLTAEALATLDLLCDKLEQDQIISYLPELVGILLQILTSNTSTSTLKYLAINALGSLATTAELKFLPHLQNVMAVSLPLFKSPHVTPEDTSVHARNIALQGKLLRIFCGETSPIRLEYFQTYVLPHLQYVYTLLNNSMDQRQIIESSFVYFYKIAEAIGQEFSVVFPRIIDRVLEVCEAEVSVDNQPTKEEEILSMDSSDNEMVEGQQILKLSVAELDMKSAALHTLGNMAEACSALFAPYMERAQAIFDDLGTFYIENIREQIIYCRRKLVLSIVKSQFGGKLPPYKPGLPCSERYPPAVEQYIQKKVYTELVEIMMTDISTDVKMGACDTIESLLKDLGPIFVEDNLPSLCSNIRTILHQQTMTEVEEEQDQQLGDDEHEQLFIDSIGDLIQRLSKVFAPSFDYQFELLMPQMMKYLNPDLEQIEKCVGLVGCIAKCLKHLPNQISNYHQELLQKLNELYGLKHERLNRNICYCTGLLFQMAPAIMQPYTNDCLQMLSTIKQQSGSVATIENALAGICRIVVAVNPPINQEECINQILACMPFTADLHEIKTVYIYFMHLIQKRPELLEPYYPLLRQWVQQHLADPKLYHFKSDFQQKLWQLLSAIGGPTNN